MRGDQDMKKKAISVNEGKVKAAFEKLQANPAAFGPVEKALNGMYTKLNLGLNRGEKLALTREIFADRGIQSASDDPPVPSSYTVPLLAYECTSCPHPIPPAYTVKTC
jgi:hypothetical protein